MREMSGRCIGAVLAVFLGRVYSVAEWGSVGLEDVAQKRGDACDEDEDASKEARSMWHH